MEIGRHINGWTGWGGSETSNTHHRHSKQVN